MDLKATAASLSEIERIVLNGLGEQSRTPEKIAQDTKLNIDSVRRAVSWLCEKGLANVAETKDKRIVLTREGTQALEKGLPEKRMLESLSKNEKMSFDDLQKDARLDGAEFNVALGSNKKRNLVMIVREDQTKAMLTDEGRAALGKKSDEQKALEQAERDGKITDTKIVSGMLSRKLLEEKENTSRLVSITENGKKAKSLAEFSRERAYNVLDPAPTIYGGKKQPYIQFLNSIRRKLTELGFKEMDSPLIVHEFYNFDVLYQPQNHPARTWTDTYQLKNPQRGKIADRSKIAAIKAAHENGGVSGSTGWGYKWSEEIAQKVMPTAHGTAHSARQLTIGVENPGKYFTIARCFRPDVLDATHLIEFNQTDGFIVGEDLNFTHLLGILEQFAKEIAGATEVRFIPDYYPFTEPSVQLSAKHPQLGWVELGGAGMFRPEMLANLGIKGQAIAWGIGIDRLAMFKLGIKDIRYLFSDDLNWLRNMPLVKE